jgi:hypothetical protein
MQRQKKKTFQVTNCITVHEGSIHLPHADLQVQSGPPPLNQMCSDPAENYTQNLEGDDQECCCVEFRESTLLAPSLVNSGELCAASHATVCSEGPYHYRAAIEIPALRLCATEAATVQETRVGKKVRYTLRCPILL